MGDTFGDRIRALRKEKGLTQAQVGTIVGLQKSGVAKYENGRIVNVSLEIAERFAVALDVPLETLVARTNQN